MNFFDVKQTQSYYHELLHSWIAKIKVYAIWWLLLGFFFIFTSVILLASNFLFAG